MLERAVTLSLLLALSVSGCASTDATGGDATGGEPAADEARAATGDCRVRLALHDRERPLRREQRERVGV
ncbi:MAG: hypothetical protein KIT58_11740, partial [Planctomycetota bacterium]|nr:hypothetical protein [Planctomycetota bacterium]